MFLPFWISLPGPGRQATESFFWLKLFLETRLSSESLESLIDFLAYLETEPWHKTEFVTNIKKFHERYNFPFQDKFWPAIALRQIKLQSCSHPLKTRSLVV